MSFFAVLCAFLLEQLKPLPRRQGLNAVGRQWTNWVMHQVDIGQKRQAYLAWGLVVLLPVVGCILVTWGLGQIHDLLILVWSVAVLYATLGFRQFSHHFTAIRDALEAGDETQAAALLAQWQQVEVQPWSRSQIIARTTEYSVLCAHRRVFGVLAWFCVFVVLGLGPAGAVFYRMSEFAGRYWRARMPGEQQASPSLQNVAAKAWYWIDYWPVRLSALSFAVVGSFEDAIDGWRQHIQRQANDNDGIMLAAMAGAIHVRLGPQATGEGDEPNAAGLTLPGADATSTLQLGHLRSVVGLLWRAVVLWMVLLCLLTVANLLG